MAVTWSSYQSSIGDRSGLFHAVRDRWSPARVLYPGSYVDLSPATAFGEVVFVDTDRRAARFFTDANLVAEELEGRRPYGAGGVRFIHADYTTPLPLADESFDLLISLYAGRVWDNCRRYLAPGGLLLANTSHGDASLAALDSSLELVAAIHARGSTYRLVTEDLGEYLVPKDPAKADPAGIRASGRGIGYTKSAFAYAFRLI